MKQSQIRHHLDSIILYLDNYWAFANCHMVNYFTDDHWNNLIPEEIRKHIQQNNIQNVIQETFWDQKSNLNPIENFVNSCKQFWLENLKNVVINVEQFYENIKIKPSFDNLSVKGFMGQKKLHEVEVTSELINNIMKTLNGVDTYIVDAGDGKGYLSSRLALQYQLKVLGIDANEINSDGAIERKRKLQRVWNGLVEREKLIQTGITPPRHGKKQAKNSYNKQNDSPINYKVVTKFISSQLDMKNIIREQFNLENTDNTKVCLTGLHTCGNLASTCLKVFKAQNYIKILCNIGCCYHLINEEFSKDDLFLNKIIAEKNPDYGFPLSKYLREQNIKLGRNARMLASQSVHRTFSNKELSDKSLFYRALLEEIISIESPHLKNLVQVGKIKKFENFQEYFKKCDEKLNLNLSHLSGDYLLEMEKKYSNEENKLNLFYLLRMCLAPIVESLILLDRLLYLYEENFDKSYLVKLFDPVVSPRCNAIISIKE